MFNKPKNNILYACLFFAFIIISVSLFALSHGASLPHWSKHRLRRKSLLYNKRSPCSLWSSIFRLLATKKAHRLGVLFLVAPRRQDVLGDRKRSHSRLKPTPKVHYYIFLQAYARYARFARYVRFSVCLLQKKHTVYCSSYRDFFRYYKRIAKFSLSFNFWRFQPD